MLRFSLCWLLSVLLCALGIPLLALFGCVELIGLLISSGKPLAHLALNLAPEAWASLSGVADAANNPHVRSFLELCMGVFQMGLLLAFPMHFLGARK